MPDPIRKANGRPHSLPRRRGFLPAILAVLVFSTSAKADAPSALATLTTTYQTFSALHWQETFCVALALGLICLSVLTSILLGRNFRISRRYAAARQETNFLRTEIDRLKALLVSEPQVLISWVPGERPDILGNISLITAADMPDDILLFHNWLEPAAAQSMEEAVENLRNEGQSFEMELVTTAGRIIGAVGRAIGASAILRLYDISEIKRELCDATTLTQQLRNDVEALKGVLDTLPAPAWARDASGCLIFVNRAYALAVDANDVDDAILRQLELFDHAARGKLIQARNNKQSFSSRLPAIAASERRLFDVLDAPSGAGTAGIAIDCTELDTMRRELARLTEAHRRVLDQLATGVAVFNGERKLIFYNTAFQSLFDLDLKFLDQAPSDNALLDMLRSAGKLPEQQDFRQWRQELHEAYRAIESQEHMWHLPDDRTLRVVTTANPEGGVTYLYEDVTEKLDMHRRYDALIKVQRETLDHLTEGVAVFGSDGCVRLHNPAFERMWKITPEALDQRPHVDAVAAWCRALYDDSRIWRNVHAAVTAIDSREPISARVERRDGMVIDLATMPLPDGATLVTFQDVTDSINIERALRERNDALEAADSIKIEFVHHVSYELRSPLTNIIGFANLLSNPLFGPLTTKQREYVGYINASTNALLAIINNILDLASIDAGVMTLNLTDVDIQGSMDAAADGVRDRLVKNDITLSMRAAPKIGQFLADDRRLRQILFNLLSNAIKFSPRGETVTLSAERQADTIIFAVTDRGPGISPEAKDKVFNWFETDPQGSEHRGPGLGLSLVRSFVELHGGRVSIDSAPGQGTTITCIFPLAQDEAKHAA